MFSRFYEVDVVGTYVYKFFQDFDVSFPLSVFKADVMSTISVAPSQLHPNSWGFTKGFEIMCEHLGLTRTPNMFKYFYHLKHGAKFGWVLLNGFPKVGPLFTVYS